MQTVEKAEAHIADAVKKGAAGITGGTRVAAFSFRSSGFGPPLPFG
jgi:hypothetical protein